MLHKFRFGFLTTSSEEIREILKAWLAITLAFSIASAGFTAWFFVMLLISFFTVGVGFLLHELGHKVVAQHYRCPAEFRAFDQMLVLAVLLSFTGFIFAAPGAVFIGGHLDARRNGIISLAGPLVNIVLSLFFLSLAFLVPVGAVVFTYGASINAWLGLFNLIPFGPLDGGKVFAWNKLVYFAVVIVAGALVVGVR